MPEETDFTQLKIAKETRNRIQEIFPSLLALAATPPEEVMKRCEISKSSADRAVNQARKLTGMAQPTTAEPHPLPAMATRYKMKPNA